MCLKLSLEAFAQGSQFYVGRAKRSLVAGVPGHRCESRSELEAITDATVRAGGSFGIIRQFAIGPVSTKFSFEVDLVPGIFGAQHRTEAPLSLAGGLPGAIVDPQARIKAPVFSGLEAAAGVDAGTLGGGAVGEAQAK